jgi:DNA-binding transcriptional regulator GbsR (MarR family)
MARRKEHTEREQFIEDMGIVMAHAGFPRIAGKIYGCLLLAKERELSTDELVLALKASRGSVSTMTRFLIQRGFIEKSGRPGHRRDYFRIRPGAWSSLLRTKMEELISFHDLIERGMSIVTQRDLIPYTRLREMHKFYEFFESQFPALFERWEAFQSQSGKK